VQKAPKVPEFPNGLANLLQNLSLGQKGSRRAALVDETVHRVVFEVDARFSSVRRERSWRRYRSIHDGPHLSRFWTDPFPSATRSRPFHCRSSVSQFLHGRGGSHYLGRTPLIYFLEILANPTRVPNPQQSHSAWDGCLGQHSSDQLKICRASFLRCQEIAIAITKHARNERGPVASNMARIDIACTVQREMRIDCVLHLQAAKLVLTF
jgi:hypothetical protein